MKKLILLAAVLIALMSFAWAQPAYATVPTGEASFVADCTGVTGHGVVPAGQTFQYELALAPTFGELDTNPSWTHVGQIANASSSDIPFDVVVPWPVNPTGWYKADIFNVTDGARAPVFFSEGPLDCPPPPPPPPPPGGEGCTPGYWRNHFEDWPPTGYSPADIFDTVFGTSYFSAGYTLGDAIWQGGGGVNKVARHGTAALLSAAHPDVNYPYTVAEVMAAVQAGNVDDLVAANELGCSIP